MYTCRSRPLITAFSSAEFGVIVERDRIVGGGRVDQDGLGVGADDDALAVDERLEREVERDLADAGRVVLEVERALDRLAGVEDDRHAVRARVVDREQTGCHLVGDAVAADEAAALATIGAGGDAEMRVVGGRAAAVAAQVELTLVGLTDANAAVPATMSSVFFFAERACPSSGS